MTEVADVQAPGRPFTTLAELRVAHRVLLEDYDEQDEDNVPDTFLARIESFQADAKATGAIIAAPEDRAEVQSNINFWLTILLNSSKRPPSVILDDFDLEAAKIRMGGAAPYKGLEPFQSADASSFFGRLPVVNSMVDRLQSQRLIAVTGLSGSGKSSVVRAGLVPQLREGGVAGSEEWDIRETIVPGTDPLATLSDVAGRTIKQPADLVTALDATGRTVVLSIDQFEEVYTLSQSGTARTLFLDSLVAAATDGDHPHVVVITMRGEYDTNVVSHEGFAKLFDDGRIVIGALTASELRAAIELPASQVGVALESGLTDELISRVLGEPAGLPLLQFTLLELWKRREDGPLLWSAYQDLGGNPRDILARRANEVFNSFGLLSDQDLSRRIFTSLVQIGEGLEALSRRVSRNELDPVGARDTVDLVLEKWRDNGLIRISPDGPITALSHVEVAHEALIRNWDRLVGWVEEAFASSRNRRALLLRAQRWKEGKEEPLGELALEEAKSFEDVDPLVKEYLDASVEAGAARRRKVEKRIRLIRWTIGILVLLVAITVITAIAALISYHALQASEEKSMKFREKLTLEQGQLENMYRSYSFNQCRSSMKIFSHLVIDKCVNETMKQIQDTTDYKIRSRVLPQRSSIGSANTPIQGRPLGFGGSLLPNARPSGRRPPSSAVSVNRQEQGDAQ